MTRAPAARANSALASSEPLSTTSTSPLRSASSSADRAIRTQAAMFSASFRQGITTDIAGSAELRRSVDEEGVCSIVLNALGS